MNDLVRQFKLQHVVRAADARGIHLAAKIKI